MLPKPSPSSPCLLPRCFTSRTLIFLERSAQKSWTSSGGFRATKSSGRSRESSPSSKSGRSLQRSSASSGQAKRSRRELKSLRRLPCQSLRAWSPPRQSLTMPEGAPGMGSLAPPGCGGSRAAPLPSPASPPTLRAGRRRALPAWEAGEGVARGEEVEEWRLWRLQGRGGRCQRSILHQRQGQDRVQSLGHLLLGLPRARLGHLAAQRQAPRSSHPQAPEQVENEGSQGQDSIDVCDSAGE